MEEGKEDCALFAVLKRMMRDLLGSRAILVFM